MILTKKDIERINETAPYGIAAGTRYSEALMQAVNKKETDMKKRMDNYEIIGVTG